MKTKHLQNPSKYSKKTFLNEASLLLDNVPDGFFRIDRNLCYTFVNRAMEWLTGLSRKTLLGSCFGDWAFFSEDNRRQMEEAARQVLKADKPRDLYISCPTDGGMMYFEIRLVPEKDPNGNVSSIIGSARDVKELISWEEKIRSLQGSVDEDVQETEKMARSVTQPTESFNESSLKRDDALFKNNRFEDILQMLPVGVALIDRDGSLTHCNKRAIELWGKMPSKKTGTLAYVEELGLSNLDGKLLDPLELPSSRALLKGENVWGEEVVVNRPDGGKFVVLSNAAPLWESGHIIGAVLAFMDVTEIKRAQELSQKMDAINLQLLSGPDIELNLQYAMTEGAKSLNADSATMSLFNEPNKWVIKKVYGLSDDILGKTVSDRKERHAVLAIQTRQPVVIEDTLSDERVNIQHLRKNGIRSVIVIPIIGAKGPYGAISFNFYSTSRFALPEIIFCTNLASSISFSLQNSELLTDVKSHSISLEMANSDLEAFSHSISHDLRAPLIVIDGFARRLMEKVEFNPHPQGLSYVNNIRESCLQGLNLVDDLLNLFMAGREHIKRETIDLTGLMSRISENTKGVSAGRNVNTSIQKNLSAIGDRRLITIALQNLFENAWKFTSSVDNALIEFGLDSAGETPTFFLRDNGCGFHKDNANKIFKPFQSAHPRGLYPGTGLGLATVQRIIHSHGGRIWAESRPGKGATFYFTLSLGPMR